MAGRLDVPVFADDDADLGALAELGARRVPGARHVSYVKAASGLGAGIVLGGRLHRGAAGIAGEIGHVQVGEDGPGLPLRQPRLPGDARRGTRAAGPAATGLRRAADDRAAARPRPSPVRRGAAGCGGCSAMPDARSGRALADLCNRLNPEAVVLGGSLGASPSLSDGVRAAIDRYAQPDTGRGRPGVAAGQLGDRAEVVGAIALAISRLANI